MLQLSEITHKSTLIAIIKYKIDIETLSEIITDDEIRQYEKDSGNS
jgi:hypothetical protein